MIADLARIYTLSDRLDAAGTFMTEHDRKCAFWIFAG